MKTLSLVATGFVLGGALIMVSAIAPVRKLMAQLTITTLRKRWSVMAALIGLFLVGYVGYAAAFWNRHTQMLDLIVPTVSLEAADRNLHQAKQQGRNQVVSA